MMLLRSAAINVIKPRNLPALSSFPLTRNFSVQSKTRNRILVSCPKENMITVVNIGTQFRLLSSSPYRFNAAEVNNDAVNNIVNTAVTESEAVIDSPKPPEELVLEIPKKPEISSVDAGVVEGTEASNELLFDLPEKPQPLEISEMLGEPSFDSLGLASWWPSGRMQYFMETLHISLELDWWQAIVASTILMRFLMFPVVVLSQKNMANMANNSPQMMVIQDKMTDARKRGDHYESAQLGQELQKFMKAKGINPLKNAAPLLLQAPVFMSFFFALRGMAYCPVDSMSTGGMFWFTDLTMKDPFWALPFLTSATFFLQLRLGAEGARLDQMGPKMKIAMTCMPFCMLPITVNFPMAVTFYWLTTNLVSLFQSQFLKIPIIRKGLNIPVMIKHPPPATTSPGAKKGFVAGFRESMDNMKLQQNIIDRRAYDEQQFREAGSNKPKKTFKYDPTKPVALKRK